MTGPVDRDILLARVIDGEASSEDWAAVKALAERDPTIWSDLAGAQQDHAELTSAVAAAIRVADEVELPIREHAAQSMVHRLRLAGAWGGWLAAAALLLAWGTGWTGSTPQHTPSNQANILPLGATADDALQAYLDRGAAIGRVVGEVPELVLRESRPLPNGAGIEIYYVRQIIERAVVSDLYRASQTEEGRVVPRRVAFPRRSGSM